MSDHTTRKSSELKKCSGCGIEKPLHEFSRNRRSADGLQGRCKACVSAWYAANRERQLERMRAWREANPDKAAEARRRWRKANPEKHMEAAARERARHPGRIKARQAIRNAVFRGSMPPARALTCACGAPAEQYHHHKGYAPEHKFDVVPVCVTCHTELHKEN